MQSIFFILFNYISIFFIKNTILEWCGSVYVNESSESAENTVYAFNNSVVSYLLKSWIFILFLSQNKALSSLVK